MVGAAATLAAPLSFWHEHVFEFGNEIAPELGIILDHREMAHAGHDGKAGAGNCLGNRFRHRRRAARR